MFGALPCASHIFALKILHPPTPCLSSPFIVAGSQLHDDCHVSPMPGTVPRCHGNNHFKNNTMHYNKLSSNESLGSLYASQKGREEPEIELSLTDTNHHSSDPAIRPLDFSCLLPLSLSESYSKIIAAACRF